MPSMTLTTDKTTYSHGDTVTVTCNVFGNEGTPDRVAVINEAATAGDQPLIANVTITLPGDPALPVSFSAPTSEESLTFSPTADPAVWTALVP